MSDRLPSWRPGPTRDAILAFLDGLGSVPIDERVAHRIWARNRRRVETIRARMPEWTSIDSRTGRRARP
jgi:hypothetical protein